ncbi:hypothetical protein N7463_004349 [Penicillium fimorum]|uniref:Uncharacterized protein n=1 Tax=Penicillium fimorum TaxID=1882269 RepID=A0A9W9Y2W1_9EURO|nr:hypothetical protein N7463_004349 [Penicillium fimorum]
MPDSASEDRSAGSLNLRSVPPGASRELSACTNYRVGEGFQPHALRWQTPSHLLRIHRGPN